MQQRNYLFIFLLILLAAVARLLPHWPNFTPVGAMALFGAAYLGKRWIAVAVTFAALYLSDLALNNVVYAEYYEGFHWGFNSWVYVGFALTLLLGFGLLKTGFSWLKLGGAAVGSALLFFLVTNFGVWIASPMYPRTGAGLLSAYAAGLPFLLNSVAGNVLFAGLLFGGARVVVDRTEGVVTNG